MSRILNSRISRTSPPAARRNARAAFTLMELLVVIFIIVLLIGIAVPMILVSYKKAGRTRVAADMATIGVALDAYRTDFGDYPRAGTNEGFAVLGRALLSPGGVWTGTPPTLIPSAPPHVSGQQYQAGQVVSYTNNDEYLCYTDTVSNEDPTDGGFWAQFRYTDGLVGPGFKVRAGGKPYPAYLQPEKFKLRGVALLDLWGKPILYFIASPRKPKLDPGWLYIDDVATTGTQPYYDASQNLQFFVRPGDADRNFTMRRVVSLMVKGDPASAANNGTIDAGDSAQTMHPFVLWSAGPDAFYGISDAATITQTAIEKCDDVTSFAR